MRFLTKELFPKWLKSVNVLGSETLQEMNAPVSLLLALRQSNHREAVNSLAASQMEFLPLLDTWMFVAKEGSRSLQWDNLRLILNLINFRACSLPADLPLSERLVCSSPCKDDSDLWSPPNMFKSFGWTAYNMGEIPDWIQGEDELNISFMWC